jgi:L-threonylcarbamoyladenylate synthase
MPSANLSSGVSPVNAEDVAEEFKKKLKFVLNGGKSKIGIESTVVDLTKKPKILRPGIIDLKKINKVLKMKVNIIKENSKIISPGMLKKHYSPGIPIFLDQNTTNDVNALITLGKKYENKKNYFNLSKQSDLKEAASNLYKTLRKIKKLKFKKIYVVKIPNIGPGIAINDRLKRAAK